MLPTLERFSQTASRDIEKLPVPVTQRRMSIVAAVHDVAALPVLRHHSFEVAFARQFEEALAIALHMVHVEQDWGGWWYDPAKQPFALKVNRADPFRLTTADQTRKSAAHCGGTAAH